jgi:hypothetical protein
MTIAATAPPTPVPPAAASRRLPATTKVAATSPMSTDDARSVA